MVAVSAKEPESPKRPACTLSNLALPIPGVPLAFEAIEKRTIRLPDGTAETKIDRVKTYRDSTGRMRIERSLDSPQGTVPLIQIFDHPAGFVALLETGLKIAHRASIPKPEGPVAQPRFMFLGGPLVGLSGERTFHTESLGMQTIEGAEFEGHRLTTTILSPSQVVGIQEHWISRDLGVIGFMRSFNPDTEETVRIQHLDRTEPDAALFVIPPDYAVQDLGSLGPDV